MTIDEKLAAVRPSKRQIAFQELEFYAFVHFSMNTFTNSEWGNGKENPALFNPEKMNAEQWTAAIKSAGMKGLILTCKHHDGFCLWPSRFTEHSVKNSPYKNGNGDIVREVSEACKKAGLRFGVYLSPWDMNNKAYGKGKEYDDYFINQLTELLTGYGEIFSIWFDGACGEGENGKKQYYDWERYYAKIRELQPNACISVCGPDIRWCGNEAGYTRPSEWSVVPERTRDTEKITAESQHADDGNFRKRPIHAYDFDLGSREVLKDETELIWYPAEVNTSIRPGWFYHTEEDDKVRSLDDLVNVYLHSVGGNATFLLNIPPDKNGLFAQNDVERLKEIGEYLNSAFSVNLADNATLTADNYLDGFGVDNLRRDEYDSWFRTADGETTAKITVKWDKPQYIRYIVLKEEIAEGQRIESCSVNAGLCGNNTQIYNGTVVGHKKIIALDGISADEITLEITDSRVYPTLSFLGIY